LEDAAWTPPKNDGTDQCIPPPKPCTARCCGMGTDAIVLNLSATGTAAACDASGQRACLAHQKTLHHVRWNDTPQTWHPCPRECCALCNNRSAYHQVTQPDGDWVFQSCSEYAATWCRANDRGGLEDAAWLRPRNDGTDQCVAPSVCGNGIREPGEACDGRDCPSGQMCAACRECKPLGSCDAVCCDGTTVHANTTSPDDCRQFADAWRFCRDHGGYTTLSFNGGTFLSYPCLGTCYQDCHQNSATYYGTRYACRDASVCRASLFCQSHGTTPKNMFFFSNDGTVGGCLCGISSTCYNPC
jgi:hypothetical protein